MELKRLREENSELKDKLMQLKNKIESGDGGAAPLGMTTFSPARESQTNIAPATESETHRGIADLGRRLYSLMGKVGCSVS